MKQPIKQNLSDLEDKLYQLMGTDIIKRWKAFQKLSYAEQSRIKQEWEEYYEACSKSPAAKHAYAMRDALKEGKIQQVKEMAILAEDIQAVGVTVKKPFADDPNFLNLHPLVQEYKRIEYEISLAKRKDSYVQF